MVPRRDAPLWWERLLPAGAWLALASLMLTLVRAQLRMGIRDPRVTARMMRAATNLSRTGFRVWRARRSRWSRS